MRRAALSRIIAGDASERELLSACKEGCEPAVERLVDLHVRNAIATARRLALPSVDNAAVLDLVHDAFITAFDDALDNEIENLAVPFYSLVRRFAQDARAPGAGVDADAEVTHVISAQDLRQLRSDLIQELRVMVEIQAESPKSRGLAQRLLAELRVLRRRVHLRTDALRARLPAVIVAGEH